jgi:hypothetical protein
VLSTVLRLVLVLVAFPGILKAPMPGFIPMREDFARLRGALSNR